ncbi:MULTISPECIES: hypothetical protein [unclassified Brevundimonas]|jgi:lipase chaperone LimK|uniref:hypothetical protein n=1 Tax=unclassified Brevundimonas TaxID=2622653 RepID=UPI000C5A4490|nr:MULTISPECIES: hypothetical protein [unclassified Brevundimonas]MAL88432.1 hypothetical protein [Brevundimonas sp.]HAJ03841.1 hypothetical protein [Brevundimonas sp.]HAV50628.1 hypothetical protein [Brevundimonas sp.]|tara:strand:- start:8639 stop:9028 length:390 start_codon:yes stop_codon:yes gene_type:complete
MITLVTLSAVLMLGNPVLQDPARPPAQDPVAEQDTGNDETQRLNARVLTQLEGADAIEAQGRAAYEAAVAERAARIAEIEAEAARERAAYETRMAEYRAEVAAAEARQARWRDQVAACERGNRAACAGN